MLVLEPNLQIVVSPIAHVYIEVSVVDSGIETSTTWARVVHTPFIALYDELRFSLATQDCCDALSGSRSGSANIRLPVRVKSSNWAQDLGPALGSCSGTVSSSANDRSR